MGIILPDWSIIAALASAISAAAAAISAFLSYRGIIAASKLAKEQGASQATLQLINLSLKNKKLSTSEKYEHYEWYVIAVLVFAREVLEAYPNDPSRRNQVKQQLKYHSSELAAWMKNDKQDVEDFGPEVSKLVNEILNSPMSVAAE